MFIERLTPESCPGCDAITSQCQPNLNEAASKCLEELAEGHWRDSHLGKFG